MTGTCKGDWRCRRLCKIGRASARNRLPKCGREGAGRMKIGSRAARPTPEITGSVNNEADAAMLPAAE